METASIQGEGVETSAGFDAPARQTAHATIATATTAAASRRFGYDTNGFLHSASEALCGLFLGT